MKRLILKSLAWIAVCASMFSFTTIGGESYTIHLNDKLLVEHHVASKSAVPSFALDQASLNDQVSVYYNECGKIGQQRKLTLQNEKGTVLAKWEFANATKEHTPMNFKAKEILALKKTNSKVKLFYSSREVSKERLLATIVLAEDVKASR